MVNQNEDDFLQQRLALLETDNVEPNLVRGRALVNVRLSISPRRWAWKLAPVGVVLVLVLALPTAKAIAQTGTFSLDTVFVMLRQVHMELFQVHRLLWDLFH